MDSGKLQRGASLAIELQPKLDGILIIGNGYIVMEEYPLQRFSEGISRILTSASIGIVIEQGHIERLEQKVVDFFAKDVFETSDPRREDITIRDALLMATGLGWIFDKEGYLKMLSSPDPVKYLFDLPIEAAPGMEFQNNIGNSHKLSAIIT